MSLADWGEKGGVHYDPECVDPTLSPKARKSGAPGTRCDRVGQPAFMMTRSFGPGQALALAVVDDQDHAGAESGDFAVVFLERRHGGVVGIGNRIEGLAGLHSVANELSGGSGRCASLGAGLGGTCSGGALAVARLGRDLGFTRAGQDRHMDIDHAAST